MKFRASAGRPFKKTCTRSTSNQFGHWTRTFSVACPPERPGRLPETRRLRTSASAKLHFQKWSARHDQVAALGGMDDVEHHGSSAGSSVGLFR